MKEINISQNYEGKQFRETNFGETHLGKISYLFSKILQNHEGNQYFAKL